MQRLDEIQLERELAEKVEGARVVKVTGIGFYAIIPHYGEKIICIQGGTVATMWLGATFGAALAVMRAAYGTKPVD